MTHRKLSLEVSSLSSLVSGLSQPCYTHTHTWNDTVITTTSVGRKELSVTNTVFHIHTH